MAGPLRPLPAHPGRGLQGPPGPAAVPPGGGAAAAPRPELSGAGGLPPGSGAAVGVAWGGVGRGGAGWGRVGSGAGVGGVHCLNRWAATMCDPSKGFAMTSGY